MKHALILLLTIAANAAHAFPLHRCTDHQGRIAFQDRPCGPLRGRAEPAPLAPGPGSVSGRSARSVTVSTALLKPGERSFQLRQRPHPQVPHAARANHAERLALLKAQREGKALEYAGNRHRCQDAMRISALCGKFAGMFFCDDQGFRPIPQTERGARRMPALSNDQAFTMEQCALQAAQ